jgi:D-alanyl-D-alanine carboxypeptidase (penicillin-binding protein 5/6)
MKRRIAGLTAIVIAAVLIAYAFAVYKKPIPALASSISPAAQVSGAAKPILQWPVRAEAAIGAEGFGVLAAHGTQKAQPTASVAKIMTALAVLRQHPLSLGEQGPVLAMTQADVDSYNAYIAEDGSVAKVVKGEKITEYQALEAMLLPSADNMADTLAKWSYGSIGSYSMAANALAASLGMNDSHFGTADASGYSPQTVSTAHDLVLLGQAALKNAVIAQIVAKPTAVVPVAGTVPNVNWLLGSYGINGIKTGNTDQAGGVFLFSARQPLSGGKSVTVIGAVMDKSATLYQALAESIPLAKSAEAGFTVSALVKAGDVMGAYNIPWSGTVDVVAAKSLSIVAWRGQDLTPKISLKPLNAPIAKGDPVGTISFGITSQTIPIVANQPIAAPTWRWRLLHAF